MPVAPQSPPTPEGQWRGDAWRTWMLFPPVGGAMARRVYGGAPGSRHSPRCRNPRGGDVTAAGNRAGLGEVDVIERG